MSPLVKERAVIDIGATATAHSDIADDLAIHGISGTVTVASLHDIGKASAIKKLPRKELSPSLKLAM